MVCSVLEIYNEKVKDLAADAAGEDLAIREDGSQGGRNALKQPRGEEGGANRAFLKTGGFVRVGESAKGYVQAIVDIASAKGRHRCPKSSAQSSKRAHQVLTSHGDKIQVELHEIGATN